MYEEDEDRVSHRGFMIIPADDEREREILSAMIAEFERVHDAAKLISVADYLGNPDLSAIQQLAQSDPETAWDELDTLLAAHEVGVEFIVDDVPYEERIRFVLEEILVEEIQDIRIKGMFSCFIYEDFHPNDAYDVQFWTETFLRALFQKDLGEVHLCLGRDKLFYPDGQPANFAGLEEYITQFWEKHTAPILTEKTILLETKITEDQATIKLGIVWYTISSGSTDVEEINGEAHFQLQRSPYSGWDVVRFQIPGV